MALKFYSKSGGIKLLNSQGYSKMEQEGECGDGGFGSRLYFRHKDSTGPEYQHDVTLSYLPRDGWTPAYFDGRHPLHGE